MVSNDDSPLCLHIHEDIDCKRVFQIRNHAQAFIYNAVSSRFHASESSRRNAGEVTGEKYILAVSSIDPRKNFSMLLKAFSLIEDKNIKLYIVGGQAHIYSTSKWLGRITDSELKEYYMNACCFIYPSLYEGFGIPPLEAMACGTPTIVSDIPPLREVCSNASLYICPLDTEDIARKIMLLVSDIELRERLRIAGYNQYKRFTWKNSANAVYDLLCSL